MMAHGTWEVPSGGDWSIHRGAALLIQDASAITVEGCRFDQVGGNGVMLSNDVQDAVVTKNEFIYTGDSTASHVN